MQQNKVPNAGERLKSASDIYFQRNAVYGDSYKMHGAILVALFPDGLTLNSKEDFNRFGVLNMKIAKLNRYCNNFNKGGHPDSIQDDGVYSFMLDELDDEYKNFYKQKDK